MLLGRQREMAALKVVGSGVDASAVGTGKTISSGRALAHRASTQPRFRGLVIAEGRLLGQWREELTRGAPGRRPAAAGAERRAARALGRPADRGADPAASIVSSPTGAGWCSSPTACSTATRPICRRSRGTLLIADEALRYANPATEAHQALAQVRFGSVADCWLLTATPRGKSAEHLDVLVGLRSAMRR